MQMVIIGIEPVCGMVPPAFVLSIFPVIPVGLLLFVTVLFFVGGTTISFPGLDGSGASSKSQAKFLSR